MLLPPALVSSPADDADVLDPASEFKLLGELEDDSSGLTLSRCLKPKLHIGTRSMVSCEQATSKARVCAQQALLLDESPSVRYDHT